MLWGRYAALEGPLTARAKSLGYALVVHGSRERDLDLLAVPWIENAADSRILAEAIRQGANARSLISIFYSRKPHGRRCWVFHLTDDIRGPYIDLSVMPRRASGEASCLNG